MVDYNAFIFLQSTVNQTAYVSFPVNVGSLLTVGHDESK